MISKSFFYFSIQEIRVKSQILNVKKYFISTPKKNHLSILRITYELLWMNLLLFQDEGISCFCFLLYYT